MGHYSHSQVNLTQRSSANLMTGVLLPVPAIATFKPTIGVLSCSYQPTVFEQPNQV